MKSPKAKAKKWKANVILTYDTINAHWECTVCHERMLVSPLWRATDLVVNAKKFASAHRHP
jgi:hypothetical protein